MLCSLDLRYYSLSIKNMTILKRLLLDIQQVPKLIRSYVFCFRYFPYEQAKKMPVFLDEPIKILGLKRGTIVIKGEVKPRQIYFGLGVKILAREKTSIDVEGDGKIVFEGHAYFSKGSALMVDSGAVLTIGNGVGINNGCFIRCGRSITLGDEVMLGWDNEISDTDGHPVYKDGVKIEDRMPITIGRHVWITSHVRIGKGVIIPDGCIVAKGAVVTKKHEHTNTLIGGVPAKDIKQGVDWSR